MQELIADPKMYCDRCTDSDGKYAEMEIRKGKWVCPRCGAVKNVETKPQVCMTCKGPWPDCMEGCKLFDD